MDTIKDEIIYRSGYPYNKTLEKYFCTACKRTIPDNFDYIDDKYHRCPFCGYNFNTSVEYLIVTKHKVGV